MNFLLDTNVVSEWTKLRPNPGVIEWLAEIDEDRVYLSVVTLAEIRFGIDRMAAGVRRDRLNEWLRVELPGRFEQRIVTVTSQLADGWGQALAHGYAVGRPVSAMNALIAATAVHHEFTLVTRNVSDFETFDIPVINPWNR